MELPVNRLYDVEMMSCRDLYYANSDGKQKLDEKILGSAPLANTELF